MLMITKRAGMYPEVISFPKTKIKEEEPQRRIGLDDDDDDDSFMID
jgi:hypothetical protein